MNKKGQVWIETVTYTLVAFVLIGLILSFVNPRIQELQDQAVIEQSLEMIKEINEVVSEIESEGIGNKRKVEVSLRKGEIRVNGENDSLSFVLEGSYLYSQPGQAIEDGGVFILTEEQGETYTVTMTKYYNDLNITYAGKEEEKVILQSPTSYIIFLTNKGGTIPVIDFELG